MRNITAYTDGSAVVSGKCAGYGGYGTYFPKLFEKPTAFSAGYKNTKTGRMEIRALLLALRAMPIKSPEPILLTVYSDSQYVVKSFTENRLVKWINHGWTNSSGKVKNRDLWEKVLDQLRDKKYLTLKMVHIKSHQYDKEKNLLKKKELLNDPHILGNTIADRLADYKRHKILLEDDSK